MYTPAHLHEVRNGLSDGYRLMQDVTLPDTGNGFSKPSWAQSDYCSNGWSPIRPTTSNSSQFTGTFDGNGHAIRNLFIRRSTTRHVGLFAYMAASGEIRDLGVHIAPTGVTGAAYVGGLAGENGGTVSNCYATGAVAGERSVGGLMGWLAATGTVAKSYATGAVSGGSTVGGLVGHKDGTVTSSYYPAGRPAGANAGGQALDSGAAEADFSGFTSLSDTSFVWKWVAGKWPQLKGFAAAQATPSRTSHTAAVTTHTTTGLAITLEAPLSGLTKDDWALYKVTSNASTAVRLTGVTTTDGGASYTFTTGTLAAGTYRLLYTKADVIVVPPASARPAGYLTVAVPEAM